MTFQDFQAQALQLPISEKWQLVQSLLNAIQQDTTQIQPNPQTHSKSLDQQWQIWVDQVQQMPLQPLTLEETDEYQDYLVEKYRDQGIDI